MDFCTSIAFTEQLKAYQCKVYRLYFYHRFLTARWLANFGCTVAFYGATVIKKNCHADFLPVFPLKLPFFSFLCRGHSKKGESAEKDSPTIYLLPEPT